MSDPKGPSRSLEGRPLDFIAISETQFFGDERKVDVMGYPLYNVMLISWDALMRMATGEALGKVYKHAWTRGKPVDELVVLV